MRYIIMADGKGTRWQNYNDIPKHFIEIGGETLLGRTVRLLNEGDEAADVIITSHDPRYEVPGARRYEPLNNVLLMTFVQSGMPPRLPAQDQCMRRHVISA